MYSILVVDDDPMIRKTVKRHLKKANYKVIEAGNGKEALAMIEENTPNLVLLDVMMPEMNGFEVCRTLRQDFRNKSIYIIILSAKGKTEEKVQGLEFGADDYVTKPFDPKELMARINTGLRSMEDKKQASVDTLTGLYNRYFFNNFFSQEMERASRYNLPFSLILIDLDFFKKVNDTYGHDVGDQVLQQASEIFNLAIRGIDIAARWGGEEFILLLPQTDSEGAVLIAERIRITMENHDFPGVGKQTASFGVATYKSPEIDIFKQVDKALYEAKETGRNKVVALEE